MTAEKITSKGQVTIPKAIRKRLYVSPGDRLTFRVKTDGSVIVETKYDIRSLQGFIKTDVKNVSVEDINEAIIAEGSRNSRLF